MTAARGGSLKAESNNLRIASPEVYFLGNTGFNFSAYLLPTLIPGSSRLPQDSPSRACSCASGATEVRRAFLRPQTTSRPPQS